MNADLTYGGRQSSLMALQKDDQTIHGSVHHVMEPGIKKLRILIIMDDRVYCFESLYQNNYEYEEPKFSVLSSFDLSDKKKLQLPSTKFYLDPSEGSMCCDTFSNRIYL